MKIYPNPQMAYKIKPSFKLLSVVNSLPDNALKRALCNRYDQWMEIYNHTKENGLLGLILAQTDLSQWAIITKEPSDKSSVYRYTLFDRKGFFGHGVYSTPESAIKAAFDLGYKHIEKNVCLNEIASRWIH